MPQSAHTSQGLKGQQGLVGMIAGILVGLSPGTALIRAADDVPSFSPCPTTTWTAPHSRASTTTWTAPYSCASTTSGLPSADLAAPFAPANPAPAPVSGTPASSDNCTPAAPVSQTDIASPASAPVACPSLPEHHPCWPEVWGFVGLDLFFTGRRTAPNGLPYIPLFDANSELNLGLLPHKKLYLFIDLDFWTQRATDGITNPHQGSFDFSKRELDVLAGFAWNYWGPLELRLFGYADNNLNRGISPEMPIGFNDGIGIENRYYLPASDPYDVGRQSFLGIGYLPSKTLIGLDGQQFTPGLFLHGYLAWDVPWRLPAYVYFDGQYFGESGARPRLLTFDAGLAVRPISRLQGLEFRLGGSDIYDVEVRHSRGLVYGAVRLQF